MALASFGCEPSATVDKVGSTHSDGPAGEVDGDGDGYPASEDCNDSQADIFPGATEICDGVDNNCSGDVDEGVTSEFFVDDDGDGFGDPSSVVSACAAPDGTVPNGDDCDDGDADIHPAAAEVCNGVDDDCDSEVDDGLGGVWYRDADGDGFGDAVEAVEGCDPGDGYVSVAGDCDDGLPEVNPDAVEVCNERDDNCDEQVDEGVTTVYFADGDGDGYGRLDATTDACTEPAGYAALGGDCDDANVDVSPGVAELCNGVDDNCDGTTDESSASDASTWYADADGDGYGDAAATVRSCSQPSDHVADATDCDDGSATTFPGAVEYCDGHDDNCDGVTDEDSASDAATWYLDSDGDGYGNPASTVRSCSTPSGHVSVDTDCDDDDRDISPAATEVCNGVDDDCDALVDDDDSSVSGTSTFYEDTDGDTYGDPSSTRSACVAPSGTVTDATDCDDSRDDVNPGASEVCNGIDDDCDGDTDDDDAGVSGLFTWYIDYDGDGHGSDAFTAEACEAPSGYVEDNDDCDDTDDTAYPDAVEECDGDDDDCDGLIDEGVLGSDAACAAESCMEVLSSDASAVDGFYYLDPDGSGASLWECDMTTDGGGWTRVADWNRVDDGDNVSDFNSEFDVLFNNMSQFYTGSTYLFWQDMSSSGSASADALSVSKDIPFPNEGEVLYEVEHDGVSMEQSGAWLWVESQGTEFNLECWDDHSLSAFSTTELAQIPSYSCSVSTASSDFSWSGVVQDDMGAELDTLRFASLMYDSCCDYSYLYKFVFWVR